jgi:hypothetical protein
VLKVAAGAICGIAAGIVAGIGARSAMRMVADGVPDPIRQLPSFTVEGTAAIVIIAALAGAPFGALFGLIHDALPGPRRARGFLFGIAMLVTVGPLFFTGTRDEFITYERMVLFSFLFPLFGVAAGLAFEPSQQLAQRLPDPARIILVLIAIGGGALVGTGIFAFVGQAVQTHGALAVAYAVPWLAVGLLAGLALRSRVSPARLAR